MFTETDLIRRARVLFPESKTDVEALDKYATFTWRNMKKYYNKPKLKAVFDECKTKYKAITDTRKKIQLKEVEDENQNV